jgi:hypothetical protein
LNGFIKRLERLMKDSNVKEAIIEGKKLIKLTLSTVKFNDFI